MEADWSLALGAGDPVIVVPWEGEGTAAAHCRFVDLRAAPQAVDQIHEAAANPPLRSALLRLNASASPFVTAKCDTWHTSPENGDAALDPYEMDADPGTTAFGAGCYIDLLLHSVELFDSFEPQKEWMHASVNTLRAIPAGSARVELVLRPAARNGVPGYGCSCFIEGCGPTAKAAQQRWVDALSLTLAVLVDTPCVASGGGRYNGTTGE